MKNNTGFIRSFGILNRTFTAYITKALEGQQVSYSESIFLVNIGENPGIRQDELATSLAVDKAAVARSVKKLDRIGYISVERTASDKRVKHLFLSRSGHDFFSLMRRLNDDWVEHVMEGIGEDDFKQLIALVGRMSASAKSFSIQS